MKSFICIYYTTLARLCKRFFRVLRLLLKHLRTVGIGSFVVRVKAVLCDSAVFLCLVFVVALALFKLFAALHFRLFFLGDRLQNQPKERHSLDAIMPARKKTSYSGKGYGVFFEMFLKKTGKMSKNVRSIC